MEVYLDNAATTKTDPEVVDAMMPYLREEYGNASASYALGRRAREAVDKAREQVASLINADPKHIIFTSGATEANNMVTNSIDTIAISSIEHPSVWRSVNRREVIGVDPYGVVKEGLLERYKVPLLFSIMYANNEIGTIQPIRSIGEFTEENGILLHTDATQAFGHIPIDVEADHIDFLSASAHKIYGPKGVGLLYDRTGASRLMFGGHQERGLRPGTENVAGIVGFGKAAELAKKRMDGDRIYIAGMRDYFIETIRQEIPDVHLNGHPSQRLPNNVSLTFRGVDAETLLLLLDQAGICASAGSACTTGIREPSRVLLAIGLSHDEALSTLRFTLGRKTTYGQLDYTIAVLIKSVQHLRGLEHYEK